MSIPIWVVVVFVILSIFCTLALRRPVNFIIGKFQERAPIIKKYWIFVIPFSILLIAAYVLVYIYAQNDIKIGIYFGIVGQVSGIILAIFAGYIAFSEFGESKFYRLVDDARTALSGRYINTSHKRLKEAYSIKPKETSVLGDLLEIELMLGLYDEFDSKIENYRRASLEEVEQLIYLYLYSLRYLVREHNSEARPYIEQSIEFVGTHPNIRELFSWSNESLVNSPAFQRLGLSSKIMAINHFSYLSRQLTDPEEAIFIGGTYDTPTVASVRTLPMPNPIVPTPPTTPTTAV